MKIIFRTSAYALFAGTFLLLCAFGPGLSGTNENQPMETSCYGSEYHMVREFVYENICARLWKADEKRGVRLDQFSRCPSGYTPYLAGHRDSVKLGDDVYGEIKMYKGCSGVYHCSFKVNAAKNVALVKGKNMSEYVTVDEWISSHKTKVEVKKEDVKQIKS